MTDELKHRFTEELAPHYGIIHKICRVYENNPANREDLLQEILFNAWQSYSRFERRANFSTWLYKVALNTALYQTRKKHKNLVLIPLESHNMNFANVEEDDDLIILYKAIGELSTVEKSIIILFLEDLPYAEIASITGLSPNNVAVKVSRIKKQLREKIARYGN